MFIGGTGVILLYWYFSCRGKLHGLADPPSSSVFGGDQTQGDTVGETAASNRLIDDE